MLGTIGTSEGGTGFEGVGGSTEVEVSAELNRHVGVVGHAELEGVSADGTPCEEEEGLAEANHSNTGPKDPTGVLVTTWIISAKPSYCFTIPSLCCQSPPSFYLKLLTLIP